MSGEEKKPKIRHKAAIRRENEQAILEAAEAVFARRGFSGATTKEIAARAGVAKANVHYYFHTKTDLYRRVLDDILQVWLAATDEFETCGEPAEALSNYIHAKMDLARARPLGSKIWATEIIQGAPIIQDFLETTLAEWMARRVACVEGWIESGKIRPVKPEVLFYMIWATTQHYADFGHQIATLNGGEALSDEQFKEAKMQVTDIILRGIGAL